MSAVDKDVVLSPSQGVRLMALCAMLNDGDLSFRGHEAEDEDAAAGVLRDIGQEIALQLGGAA